MSASDTYADAHAMLRAAHTQLARARESVGAWDDAAASKVQPLATDVATQLGQMTNGVTQLSQYDADARQLADTVAGHTEAAEGHLQRAAPDLDADEAALDRAEQAATQTESLARESGRLVDDALRELSRAGARCGLATNFGHLEGAVASRVREVRIRQARQAVAATAGRAVASEVAWELAEKLALGGTGRLIGDPDVELGPGGWEQVRTTATELGTWASPRITAWVHQMQNKLGGP